MTNALKAKNATITPANDLELIAKTIGVFDFPGHLFRVLDIKASEAYTNLSPLPEITPRQVAVLLVLYQVGSASQSKLSDLIRTDRNTLAEMLSRMVAKGYLERSASLEDRRIFNLTLTNTGREILFEVLPAMLQAQKNVLDSLPTEYHSVFMKCLGLLTEGCSPSPLTEYKISTEKS